MGLSLSMPLPIRTADCYLVQTRQVAGQTTVKCLLMISEVPEMSIISRVTRGVQKVRGPTKKENEFYDETRCEGCDVIKTTPDAATSQSVLLLCSGCWLL